MKGNTEIKVNQSTMVEALQQYFDGQFTEPNRMCVTVVSKDESTSYSGVDHFIVKLAEKEAAKV